MRIPIMRSPRLFRRSLSLSVHRSVLVPSSTTGIRRTNPIRRVGSLSGWWKTFKKEFKEQLTPIPDPPGYINTAPFNPSRWEQMPPEDFRYAIRLAWREYKNDFTVIGKWYQQKNERSSTASSTTVPSNTATSDNVVSPLSSATPAPSAESDTLGSNLAAVMVNTTKLLSKQGIPQTSEEIRNVSILTAKKLMDISKNKGFQEQITQLSAEGLKTARECLDQFLVGYAEGKNTEILAYIREQNQQEKDFLQKVQDIQKQFEATLQAQQPEEPDNRGNAVTRNDNIPDSLPSSNGNASSKMESSSVSPTIGTKS